MRFLLTSSLALLFAASSMNAIQQPVHKKKTVVKPAAQPTRTTKQAAQAKQQMENPKTCPDSSISSSSKSRSHCGCKCSSSSSDAYDGAYTKNLDTVFPYNPPTPSVLVAIPNTDPPAAAVIFDTNEPGSPKNIGHPVTGPDFTRFRIKKSGVYLINWNMTIGCTQAGNCVAGAYIQLYDAANDVALEPNPYQFVDTELFSTVVIDSEAISGQQIIHLDKGVELQLRVIPGGFTFGELWVANPSFTIAKIAD